MNNTIPYAISTEAADSAHPSCHQTIEVTLSSRLTSVLRRSTQALAAITICIAVAACGGGRGGSSSAAGSGSSTGGTSGGTGGATGGTTGGTPGGTAGTTPLPPSSDGAPPPPAAGQEPSTAQAARFLTQSTFGIQSPDQVEQLRKQGFDRWIYLQQQMQAGSHLAYLDQQKAREKDGKPTEEMSYEAVWQQWLREDGQLRARTSWALLQVFVISNIAPDIRPLAMSSYMDMLNRNAFGNYRKLLEDVTLHPAMGYYLNMLQSAKEDPKTGSTPNENYAREVLQLFSIGLVQLNPDGTKKLDANGKPIPTYTEEEVKGFAKAFSGWSYAGADTTKPDMFERAEENWTEPMKSWPSQHSTGTKKLLNGTVLPAGQTPEQDMKMALDNIFNHPNVAPFISTRLIQRFVTSNPSPAYVARVAAVFENNGQGTRGDLGAVVKAVLLDTEARDMNRTQQANTGKLREPVIRFANYLRALNATSKNGLNDIHYLDSADNALGQSPLLAPSVFNFYSPEFKQAGAIARAGLNSPEFQITTETTVVGSLNFFTSFIRDGGYGSDDYRLKLDTSQLQALANNPTALVDRINLMFFAMNMSDNTRNAMLKTVTDINANNKQERVQAALILTAIAPDYVIQK